ncbi:MAG: hypothetical protein QXH08_05070, partial [Candidatus Hadarchaeales archaeon]
MQMTNGVPRLKRFGYHGYPFAEQRIIFTREAMATMMKLASTALVTRKETGGLLFGYPVSIKGKDEVISYVTHVTRSTKSEMEAWLEFDMEDTQTVREEYGFMDPGHPCPIRLIGIWHCHQFMKVFLSETDKKTFDTMTNLWMTSVVYDPHSGDIAAFVHMAGSRGKWEIGEGRLFIYLGDDWRDFVTKNPPVFRGERAQRLQEQAPGMMESKREGGVFNESQQSSG